ncbi:MAG: AraC family transcriptional regulator [Spirochaetes bacterium]|nr:AraC family transcriptional regulator [Spirochaetota bacterium]
MPAKYDLKKAIGRIMYKKAAYPKNEKFQNKTYVTGINRVIDYIELNLDEDLRLEELARIANYSKYYFHRIFKAVTGESLHRYIRRLRIEKAAAELFVNPDKKITNVAYNYGFGSSSSFGRIFKRYFLMSPGAWQRNANKEINNENDQENNFNYLTFKPVNFIKRITLPPKKIKLNDIDINIKDISDINVAYLRHTGPDIYDSDPLKKLYTRLCNWAEAYPDQITEKNAIVIYHDHFGITNDSRLRTSICMKIPSDIRVTGETGKMIIPGGKYAVGYYNLPPDENLDVTQVIYRNWLPASGYCVDKKRLLFSKFQNYLNPGYDKTSQGEIYIPIRPL